MNKKQLTMQNSSLFAELERKAKEIEILNIRLEEYEQKLKTLDNENEAVKQSLEKADNEIRKLSEKNKELESSLADAVAKSTTNTATAVICEKEDNVDFPADDSNKESSEFTAKIQSEATYNTEYAEGEAYKEVYKENIEATNMREDKHDFPAFTSCSTEADLKEASNKAVTSATSFDTKIPEATLPTSDLLCDYGAKTIGKVTRVTAEVISKVNNINDDVSKSLKTLALGKNESFKFQIIELAKQKTNPEKTMREMDLLADEAIVYLRSI